MSDANSTRSDNTAIVEINEAERRLAMANDIHEMMDLRDKAAAMVLFANAQGFKEAAQKAKIFQLKAERKAGAWLAENVNHNGGRPEKQSQDETVFDDGLPEGIDKSESHRWQLEASLPEEKFNAWIDQNLANGWEISAAGLRKVAANKTHVSFNTGESEWYTPPEYILAATAVMGRIDLDPASSEIANRIVQAETFYTVDDDGLDKFWAGKVWLNPPYSTELIKRFVSKYVMHVSGGDIFEGIVLVNNATETQWFRELVSVSSAIVFPGGRIKFLDPQGNPGAPLQGQAILYAGPSLECFIQHFEGFGWSARLK
jgi:phage N-6-adenine-methyltransferase